MNILRPAIEHSDKAWNDYNQWRKRLATEFKSKNKLDTNNNAMERFELFEYMATLTPQKYRQENPKVYYIRTNPIDYGEK